jgi:acyl transferase domain-containing protein
MFDGQGAFAPGFGKQLMGHSEFAQTFVEISRIVDKDLAEWAFGKSSVQTGKHNGRLQITLFALNMSLVSLHERCDVRPSLVMGHSLGEFCALQRSGVLTLADAALLVMRRGELMEEAAKLMPQDMVAVFTDRIDLVESLCTAQTVIATHNAKDQMVIAGPEGELREIAAALRALGILSRPLKVGVACHSPLLAGAERTFEKLVEATSFAAPSIPFLPIQLGHPTNDPVEIKRLLRTHMTSPVRWLRALTFLEAQGPRSFIEMGPSKILKGFALKSCQSVTIQACGEV